MKFLAGGLTRAGRHLRIKSGHAWPENALTSHSENRTVRCDDLTSNIVLPNSGKPGFDFMIFFRSFRGNFSVTLTLRSHLLRQRFEFERYCSHLRQVSQTKREHGHSTVNEALPKVLCPWA